MGRVGKKCTPLLSRIPFFTSSCFDSSAPYLRRRLSRAAVTPIGFAGFLLCSPNETEWILNRTSNVFSSTSSLKPSICVHNLLSNFFFFPNFLEDVGKEYPLLLCFLADKMLPRALLAKFVLKPSTVVSPFQFNQQACCCAFTVLPLSCFDIHAYYLNLGFGIFLQRALHSRNKKALEFIAKGWNALKEVDRVIDYSDPKHSGIVSLLRVMKMLSPPIFAAICFFIWDLMHEKKKRTFSYLRFNIRQLRRISSLLWKLIIPIPMLGIGCPDCIWNTLFQELIKLCKSILSPHHAPSIILYNMILILLFLGLIKFFIPEK